MKNLLTLDDSKSDQHLDLSVCHFDVYKHVLSVIIYLLSFIHHALHICLN